MLIVELYCFYGAPRDWGNVPDSQRGAACLRHFFHGVNYKPSVLRLCRRDGCRRQHLHGGSSIAGLAGYARRGSDSAWWRHVHGVRRIHRVNTGALPGCLYCQSACEQQHLRCRGIFQANIPEFRHNDGSNQLGNLTASGVPYADYTGYVPLNLPSTVPVNPATVLDVNHWQPLQYFDATGTFVTPKYIAPFWGKVTPFALTSGDQFRSVIAQSAPALFGSAVFVKQAQDLITISANLTDEQKMIAEYWADGPRSELPPGHWDLFAQLVSARDEHGLDDDVKMFFAMTNAIFDGGIVAWDAKRAFNSVRPVTAIPFLFQGQQIQAWGGPFKGTITMDGRNWTPYQPSTFPTPPFPECSSGHSTFSAAGAEILKLFTESDAFGNSVSFLAGTSKIEPGHTPAQPLTLTWNTFTDAANQAGISRRYGGIHFEAGDQTGRVTGRLIADQAWAKAVSLWRGGKSADDSESEEN